VKPHLLRIVVLVVLAVLVIAAWRFSFGAVWDAVFVSIFVAGLFSAWIASLRMRRKIRSTLGKKATEEDLASIKAWMMVDENEEVAGHALPSKEPVLTDDQMTAGAANADASGLSEPVSLISHSYLNAGSQAVPAEFGAGKLPYVLLALVPILLICWAGPATLSRASSFPLALTIYAVLFVAAAACLHTLKIQIRSDGISYSSLFCKTNTIAFSEISSAIVLTDPHYRSEAWPEFNWHDFIITPKPETGKPPIKIALLLFPSEARDQLTRVLMPQRLDTGGA